MRESSWLQPLRDATAPTAPRRGRLVCWPQAGGSAAAFQPFATALPDIEVWAVQLPGRGGRLHEEPATDPEDAVTHVRRSLRELPPLDGPLVLLGHSMGAALAHLLAVRTSAELLVLSAWPATDPGPSRPGRTTEELLAFVRELDSPGTEDLEEADVIDHLLPPLRADLRLGDALKPPRQAAPVKTPTLLVYADDDPAVEPHTVLAWQNIVDVHRQVRLTGGHFALFHQVETVADAIVRRLDARPALKEGFPR